MNHDPLDLYIAEVGPTYTDPIYCDGCGVPMSGPDVAVDILYRESFCPDCAEDRQLVAVADR